MNNLLTLDPASATGNEVVQIAANLYDFLIELHPEETTRILPGLAQQWEIAPDGRSLSFVLRRGVRFHSGAPVTAEDVVWSLRRVLLLNLALASPWKSYGFSAKNVSQLIRTVDEYSLRIDLPTPTDPKMLLYTLATSVSAVVLDRREVMAHEKNGDMGAAWLTTHAAGSGPFRLDQWRAKEILMMSRNDDYWRGPAKLRRVVMRHMTESQSMRLMLARGDLDMATGLSVPDINALKAMPGLTAHTVQRGTLYYVAMSMQDAKFADVRVRRAMRKLIDYQGIDRAVMPYYGLLHQRPIPLGLAATLPEPGYALDVAGARALLASAGLGDGFNTTIRVVAEAPFVNIATSLQATLAQAGIQAAVLPGTGNQVYGAMRERKFEIIVGRGGGGAEPHPHSSLRALVYNPDNRDAARLTNFQGWRTGFHSPRLNRLIETALLEPDAERQLRLYQEIQQVYDEEGGAIQPLSQMVETVVYRDAVRGYVGHPSATTRLHAVHKHARG
ncbi:ABC transporter substrate-binding protein [Acidovorax sp. CCYZU-2555]|uniref:ABC transporter substrate-binding protein n=1 Tax=Acidovorax sp. CCYZU-2555 TaxID=2835042 RepID=UPI0020BF9903|nr:ABC transporter substrate-binding protein [Acidovorax sp. CCYZU-2555]